MSTHNLPKISVLILSYNFEKYLRECTESILAQTLPVFELIICDDHSLDNSWSIICEYKQKYPQLIRAHRQEKNVGVARNENYGRRRARGHLFAWLDGDDRWLPRKLELEWAALKKHPEAKIAYSNVYTIDEIGKRTGIWYDGQGPAPPSGDVFVAVFSKRFFPNNRGVFRNILVYRSAMNEIGDFDENLKCHWDWDEKIRFTAKFPVAYSGEALVEYRIHDKGIHNSSAELLYKSILAVYEKNLPLLDRRSKKEAALIKCHVEDFLAQWYCRLPSPDSDYYSPRSMYERNRALLGQLPKHDRVVLGKELASLFAQLARQLIVEELEKGNRKLALKYWLEYLCYNRGEFDLKLPAKIILPQWAYSRLKAVYRGFHDLQR